jgi:hypothetical protein
MIWKWIFFYHHVHPLACNPIKTHSIFFNAIGGHITENVYSFTIKGALRKMSCLSFPMRHNGYHEKKWKKQIGVGMYVQ